MILLITTQYYYSRHCFLVEYDQVTFEEQARALVEELEVSAIWESIKKVFSGIITFIKGVFTGNWEMAWNGIKDIIGGVFDAIVAIVKAPINAVIGFINAMLEGITSGINGVISLLNKINIKLPEWLPLIGGKELGFNLKELTAPQIPLLANGAVLQPNRRCF